jgi:hypothetical protein
MSTKTKTFKCQACGKTSEKIGVTSIARQILSLATDEWNHLEVAETLHGFCLACSAEVPAVTMKELLKGGEMAPDYHSLLSDLVNPDYVPVPSGSTIVSLKLLNKARVALGLAELKENKIPGQI